MNILNFITPSEYFFYLNNEKDSVIFVIKKMNTIILLHLQKNHIIIM